MADFKNSPENPPMFTYSDVRNCIVLCVGQCSDSKNRFVKENAMRDPGLPGQKPLFYFKNTV